MGFLENLWDEIIAGPAPVPGAGWQGDLTPRPPSHPNDNVLVTRRITIVRTTCSSALLSGTDEPLPPEEGIPSADLKRLTRRKSAVEPSERAEPRSPTVYDWIVISALDR
ncbi:hypothetical protein SAY87_018253 [Trapa incisa]|uniref:Uncharacterized protein n=1 Tax=Trapa incisa TaxID=236973 RepID=A0AAN7QV33_9MYRT|nr:hypothetical protein SAY87_018253 [Trapa incisa]